MKAFTNTSTGPVNIGDVVIAPGQWAEADENTPGVDTLLEVGIVTEGNGDGERTTQYRERNATTANAKPVEGNPATAAKPAATPKGK